MRGLQPAPGWLTEHPIAHRGFHDIGAGRAENSLGAFRAAIDAGFAIECDLQMCATGEPVVFHDPVLKRMTGLDGAVADHTPAELREMRLLDTADGIRTLRDHLDLVAGRVPVVLELKTIPVADCGFVAGVATALTDYKGPAAVMSFDHDLCAQFAALLPKTPRGLTAEGDATTHAAHRSAMTDFDLNFVSYDVNELPNAFVDEARQSGLPVICWTVRTPQQIALSRAHSDQMTFEGFDPR